MRNDIITPELKEYEEKITGAEEKILQLESELYEKLLTELQDYIAPMQVNGTCARSTGLPYVALPTMLCSTITKNLKYMKA